MSNNKRILVALDESDASRRAAEYVAQTVDGAGGFHVGLLHVELPPRMLEWGGSEVAKVEERVEDERTNEYHAMEAKERAKGRSLLQQFQASLAAGGTDVMGRFVEFKEPLNASTVTSAILDTAREHDCGTIVVGRHSFSGIEHWFKKHVAEELIREATGMTIWVVE